MTGLDPEYRRHRARMIAYGRWDPFVPADKTIAHLRMLIDDHGMGARRISTLAGLAETIAERILGTSSGKPVTKVRRETEAAILGVWPDLASLNPGASVDGCGTRRRLQALIWCGWTVDRIAEHAGRSRSTVAHWLVRDTVAAKSALATIAVYEQLWNTPPPDSTRKEQLAAARARKMARDAKWTGPWSWDEDTIDDPAAEPYREERRSRRSVEDTRAEVDDLVALELTTQEIAWRLGLSLNYVRTLLGERAAAAGQSAVA